MMEKENQENLRKKINELVSRYSKLKYKSSPFKAGETLIPPPQEN